MIHRLCRVISLIVIILVFMLYSSQSALAVSPIEKHVLIINAFTPEFTSDELKNKGLKNTLNKNSKYKFSYSYEYLNMARFSKDPDYFRIVAQYLKEKYKNHQPDFIFTDTNSYPLFKKYEKNLFPNVPVIMDWNVDKEPLKVLNSNFCVIERTTKMEENIELILQNKPLTKKIYIVLGDSAGERNILKNISPRLRKYSTRVDFVLMNKLPYEKMLERIRNAEDNSVVLMWQWFSDVNNKSFVGAEVVKTVFQESKVPVYGIVAHHVGKGMVGGYVSDMEICGKTAANTVLSILNGKKPFDNPIIHSRPYRYVFDWRQLKKWEIDENKLPSESIIKYRQLSVWEKYRGYIVGGFALIVIQSFLIMMLLINRKRRKNAEEELIMANVSLKSMAEKLIDLDKMKDEFLVNTSHELQTPLNGIINISETLVEGNYGSVNQKQKEELQVILAVSRKLSSLIKDIIDVEKIKRNEIQFNMVSLDIKSASTIIVDVFRHLIQSKNIDILVNIPEGISPVFADENRLWQILFNLIGNAIKFTERGTIAISAIEDDEFIKIMIEDTGIGISKENQENLFNAFTQANTQISSQYGGSGLGLYISKQLLERMNGKIFLEWSELKKGTCFSFTLSKTNKEPVNIQNMFEVNHDLRALVEKTDNKTHESFKVLAVDDEPTNLRVLKSLLTGDGYEVLIASSGLEGIEIIKEHNDIDLVLMDVMMPHMSGYEACRKIREDYSLYDLPILILTVRNTPEDIAEGFVSGANDFVSKPFVAKELRARVATLLHMKKSVEDAFKNEMAFLQAQIKPHFLYNAMSTIMCFCYTDGEKAGELMANLSEYLHKSFNIDNTSTTVSLENELDLTRAYTEIEKARFEERLTVEYDVDESLMEQRVLPLTIQPLVENAIRHGLMTRKSGGTVKITVKKEMDKIRISVEDNGIGIEDIEAIFKSNDSLKKRKGGVGLSNIKRRLMKYYGVELCVDSTINEGTKVCFTIPDKYVL